MAIDPYRTLGLEPGASPAEIKRAYRRLAKAFHPDSAGEAALPRFLAIHEAYDRLTGGSGGALGRNGSAATSRSTPTAEPWRADPARARAAREQARTRRGRPGAPADGHRSGPGAGPGARGAGAGPEPAGRRGGDASGAGTRGGTGSTRGPAGASGQAGASGTAGRSTGPQAKSRRRTTRKATLGSTSYDEARDPADPTWGGAAWYGPTSGEYWTVNPREYADPRKHGPEYQSRARRESPTAPGGWSGAVAESDAAPGAADLSGGPAPTGTAGAGPTAGAWSRPGRRRVPPAYEQPLTERPMSPVSGSPGTRLASVLGADHGDPMRRLGFVLLAWAPLGIAAAAVIGQATGCTAYSASCGATEPLLPWLAQAAILGVLLLVPALSRILAVGTLALLLALLPIAGFFVAFGGAGQSVAAIALVVLLSLAWLTGVGAAVMTTWRVRAPRPSR